MGKYYSRQGRNLYIYVSGHDDMIDLNFFPPELKLFDTESAWRIMDRMAVVNDADEASLDKAEVILSLNSYERRDRPEEELELYFTRGDESALEAPVEPPVMAPEPAWEGEIEQPDTEVIIPEAIPPLRGPKRGIPQDLVNGVIIPLSTEQQDEPVTPTPDDIPPETPVPPITETHEQPDMEPTPHICEKFDESYRLTTNGIPVNPVIQNYIDLTGENIVKLESHEGSLDGVKLLVDDRLLEDGYRPSDAPEALMWRWIIDEPSGHYILRLRSEDIDEFWFEIRPSDVTVWEDSVKPMIDETTDFYINLVYSKHSTVLGDRQAEWFNLLDAHWKELEPTLEMLALSPLHSKSTKRMKKPISEVRGLGPGMIESISREFGGQEAAEGKGTSIVGELLRWLPLRVPVEEEHFDFNLAENRLLKSHMWELVSCLGELQETALERDSYLRNGLKRSEGEATVSTAKEFLANQEVIGAIERLKNEVEQRLDDPTMAFLERVAPHRGPTIPTSSMQTRPHYSRLYSNLKAFEQSAPPSLMRLGRSISRMVGRTDPYARWCMVKIIETLVEMGYEVEEENLVRLEGDKIIVDEGGDLLLSGIKSKVKVFHEKLYENEPPYGSYSTPKKVTIALEVFRGEDVPTIFVFEPRYDLCYTEDKFVSGDLDRLHVLHDSIVDLRTERPEGRVGGCFVLHPAEMDTISYGVLKAVSLRFGIKNFQLYELLRKVKNMG